MAKKNTAKRNFLTSLVATGVSMSMLVGTTFAWFTDSVTSSGNIIKSGTLEVGMYWADGKNDPKATEGWTDASEGAIFNYALWEPGYSEVRHIKIKNEGSLALKYQVVITANGEVSDLSDVIDVYYLDPAEQIETSAKLAQKNPMGTLTQALKGMPTTAGGELEAGKSDTVTIALKMQTSAGNEYQNKSIGSDFSIQVIATQLASEMDGFGDNEYDKGAAWDGTYPTSKPDSVVIDEATKTIDLNDAQAFAYLGKMNDEIENNYGGRRWEWEINLNVDVNLFNQAWEPVALTGFKAFNGNRHTISNIYVTKDSDNAGLFSSIGNNDSGSTKVSYLSLENVYVNGTQKVGALVGYGSQLLADHVSVSNATLIGTKYVGGLIGHSGTAINCTVEDSSVTVLPTANGGVKEAGGLIGYTANDGEKDASEQIISGNIVKNTVVSAPTVASGLVSQTSASSNKIILKNNKLDNVTITTEDTTAALFVSSINGGYATEIDVSNTADANSKVCYQVPGTTIVTDKTTQTITINSANDLAYLKDLANGKWAELYSDGKGTTFTNYNKGAGKEYYYHDSWKIVLNADIDLQNKAWTPVGITFFGTFDGQNHVISNLNVNSSDQFAGLFSSANGVENLKIENAVVKAGENAGAVAGYIVGGVKNVTVTNANITGPKYAGGIAGSAYGSFTDCSITDSTVTGNRKDAGGIVGFLNETRTLTGNKVNNTTVQIIDSAETDRNIGAIVGRWNHPQKTGESTLSGNTTNTTYALIGAVANGTMPTQAN